MQFIHFFDLLIRPINIVASRIVLALFLLSFFVANIDAQTVKTNENGDMIVVFGDGSWRYFDDKNPSDQELLRAQSQSATNTGSVLNPASGNTGNEENDNQEDVVVKEEKPKKKKSKSKKKRSKSSKKKKSKSSKKKKSKKSKAPMYSPEIEAEARQEAIVRAEKMNARAETAQTKLEDAEFSRIFAEEEVKEAYENPDKTNDDIDILEKKLIKAKAEESNAKKNYQIAKENATSYRKMINMDKAKRDKILAKLNGGSVAQQLGKTKSKKKKSKSKKYSKTGGIINPKTSNSKNKQFKTLSKSDDVMFNPPSTPCEFAYDGFDEFSGKQRKELEKTVLFAHTNDRLKPIFREKDHIYCEAGLSSIAGISVLDVEITIASEMAQREFGALDKGSYLTVKLINGSTVQLVNKRTDIGVVDKFNRSVKYVGRYVLSKDHEKLLMKSEIDKVRIIWGTGYEDYEVYEMDFFRDQLSCLKAK